jgi:TolB-like protein
MPDSTAEIELSEYRFDQRRVVGPLREVWFAEQRVAIEPKAFDLLIYLIRNRHRAVSKDELQDNIWPGVIITDAALTRCVMKARRASGGDAIATVRGHGYRFAVEVEEIATADLKQTGKFALPDKPSLAVLPFVNLSSDREQEYFSDGITEDIITELSRFRSLFVIGRQSAFTYKGRSVTTRQIGSELGVAYVVDGSIRRSRDRVRVNVRLVDASQDTQLWAERFDRDIEDILLVQEEVARTVAATIGGRVEATRGRQRLDKMALESYDRLLKAQALYYDYDKSSNAKARDLLEAAVQFNPDNARALALLAAVHSMDSWSYWTPDSEKSKQLSLEFGRRSISLDDTDSLAHALFAEILYDCDQGELAEHHFSRAITLNPNDIAAHALYASKLRATGRVDQAIAHIAIAKRLDPFGLLWIALIEGYVLFAARRIEDSIAAFSAMTSPPNEARFLMTAAYARLGRKDDALRSRDEFLESARREMPNYPGDALDSWTPIFSRMLGNVIDEELEYVLESLRLAGWDESL